MYRLFTEESTRLALRFSIPDVSFPIAEPAAHGHFQLREELDAFFALHVQVAEEGLVPAVEREPGHGGGHADVDADHAALDAVLEFARGLARTRENGGAISIGRAVGQLNGGVEISYAHHVKHGAKDFLAHHGHAGMNFIEHCRAEEEAVGGGTHFDTATVSGNGRAFFDADFNQLRHTFAML